MLLEIAKQFFREVQGTFISIVFLISLNLGSSHQTVSLFVFQYIYIIATATLHTLLLFTEGAKEVLHQTPMQESTILVGPRHLQTGEVAHLGIGFLCGCDEAFLLIEIEEYSQFVVHLCAFRYISFGQEYFHILSTVEV